MSGDASDQRLEAILHTYLQAVDRGERPDRQALLDANPDLRDALAEYLADASKLDRLAKSLDTLSFAGETTPAADPVTIRYFGDYELQSEIARGSMGVVYKAFQIPLRRVVALKMILKGQLASAEDVRRFRQEAEAAANLDHPNIVPIYEVGEHEGQQYYSMKLIANVVPETPARSRDAQRKMARTLAKVARGVHHAHQRGILHRDLKPSNILIDPDGEPHVADFGLAKRVDVPLEAGQDATRSGLIVGTPAYMAPEQARADKQLTTAVDVYSLGAILYGWLAGRPPFRGEDAMATLMKAATDEPPPLRRANRAVDRDLETICLRCLEKDPARRYGSAEALAEDLDRWHRGEPIVARPITLAERVVKWARRRPAAAALVAVCVCAAIAVAASAVVGYRALEDKVRAERDTAEQREKSFAELQEEQTRTKAALDAEQATAYAGRIAFAHAEWRSNDLQSAREIHAKALAARRGWEWHYLDRVLHSEIQTIRLGDDLKVTAVAISPNGTIAASGLAVPARKTQGDPVDATCDIRFWNVDDGKPLEPIRGLSQTFSSLALSESGQRTTLLGFSPSPDRDQAIVWDVGSRKEIFRATAAKGYCIYDGSLNAAGSTLAINHKNNNGNNYKDSYTLIYDVGAKKDLVKIPCRAGKIALSPDGSLLADSDDGVVAIRNSKTGELVRSCVRRPNYVTKIVFSPDGSLIAAPGDSTDVGPALAIWVWMVAERDLVARFVGHSSPTDCCYSDLQVVFNQTGDLCASSSGGFIRIWQSTSGLQLFAIPVGRISVDSLAFLQDGVRLAAALGKDGPSPVVKVWNFADNPEYSVLDNMTRETISLRNDGRQVAAICPIVEHNDPIGAWSVLDGSPIQLPPTKRPAGGLWAEAAFCRTGEVRGLLTTKDGRFEVWNLSTGAKLCTLAGQHQANRFHHGRDLSADGECVLICDGDPDRAVKVFDAASGAVTSTLENVKFDSPRNPNATSMWAGAAEFSRHGRLVICRSRHPGSGDSYDALHFFDRATGKQLWFRQAISPSYALSEDDRLLAAFLSEGRMGVWDIETGTLLCQFADNGRPLAFRADGKILATSTSIRKIDGSLVCRLTPQAAGVAAFVPGANRLAAVADGAVRFWDTAIGQQTLVLRDDVSGRSSDIRFTPDGNRLVTLGLGDQIRVYNATPRTQAVP
jgi:eukaryotic-like serine/threonine-protein kinase